MYLVLKAIDVRNSMLNSTADAPKGETEMITTKSATTASSSHGSTGSYEATNGHPQSHAHDHSHSHTQADSNSGSNSSAAYSPIEDGGGECSSDSAAGIEEEHHPIEPLPPWLEPYRKPIVVFMIVCFAAIIFGTVVLDVYMGIQPEE